MYSVAEFIRKHKALVSILFVVMFSIFILSGYSTIDIQVSTLSSNSGDKYTYKLYNQNTHKTAETKTNSTHFKKFVRKASYEISVIQNDKSSFKVTKTSGFLSKTTISAALKQEKGRQFVGNNPESLMNYVDNTLISYANGDSYSDIKIHVPATKNLPTYVSNYSSADILVDVEGIVNTKEGALALVHPLAEVATHHWIYRINASLGVISKDKLSDLDTAKSYSIKPYRNGFLVYDSSFEQMLYYASAKSKPVIVPIDKPKDDSLQPLLLSMEGESILTIYSNIKVGGYNDELKAGDIKNEAFIYKNGVTKQYTLNGQDIVNAVLCGDGRLCLVGNKQLSVYDISGKPKLSYLIRDVKTIENIGKNTLVIRDKEILNLDASTGTGFIEYSLGSYQYCGIQGNTNSYLLCLINNKNNKVALRIDQTVNNRDSIDKKVSKLQAIPEVDAVSAYGKYIYISPGNLGSLEYNSVTQGYDYNSATKKSVKKKINDMIDKAGIDRTRYLITVLL